jgi:hypothetical protein
MTPVVIGAGGALAAPAALGASVLLLRLVPAALRRRPLRHS